MTLAVLKKKQGILMFRSLRTNFNYNIEHMLNTKPAYTRVILYSKIYILMKNFIVILLQKSLSVFS